jgi:hypothetical protein
MEFDLQAGSSSPLRFGSTSGERFFLYDGGSVPDSATFENVILGQSYFVVIRVQSRAGSADLYSAIVYSPSETVPLGEPLTWDRTHAFSSNAIIDSIQLWIGAVASGQFDEIRIGTSWLSVIANPIPGDFDGDHDVDGSDFAAWQTNFPKAGGATVLQGDADGDGDVDGADFVVWQTNFSSSSPAGSSPVPESTTAASVFIGVASLLGFKSNFMPSLQQVSNVFFSKFTSVFSPR